MKRIEQERLAKKRDDEPGAFERGGRTKDRERKKERERALGEGTQRSELK